MKNKVQSYIMTEVITAVVLIFTFISGVWAMPAGYPNGMYIGGAEMVPGGETAQYSCVLTYATGEEYEVVDEGSAYWMVESGPASIDANTGILTANAVTVDSAVQLYVEYYTDSGDYYNATKQIMVTSAPPPQIIITGPETVGEGLTQSYIAMLVIEGEADLNISSDAGWESTGVEGCSVSNGQFTAGMVLVDTLCTITASYDGTTGSKDVTVLDNPVTVIAIRIEGPDQLPENSTTNYTCFAQYSDEGFADSNITDSAEWQVEDIGVASIQQGVLSIGEFSASRTLRITAVYGGYSVERVINLFNVLPERIEIHGPDFVDEGTSSAYECIAIFEGGIQREVTLSALWSCDPSEHSIVDGIYTPVLVAYDSNCIIRVEFDGLVDTKNILIKNVPLNSLAPQSFEGGVDDWVLVYTNGYTWSSGAGPTPTDGTGPSQASDQSDYLFTEASGNMGKTAIIESPEFSLEELAIPVLAFDYHMYGVGMGHLYVDIYNGEWVNSVWSSSDRGVIHYSGDDDWTTAKIDLSGYKAQSLIKIRFRGIVGDNFLSDMAIDNVRVIDFSSVEPILFEEWVIKSRLSGLDAVPDAAPEGDNFPNLLKYATGLSGGFHGLRDYMNITNGSEFIFYRGRSASDVEIVPRWTYDLNGYWTDIDYTVIGVDGDRDVIKANMQHGDRGFLKLEARSEKTE